MPRRTAVVACLLAALAACTAEPGRTVADPAPPTQAPPAPVAPVVQEDVGEVPLARDAGYDAAVAALGAEEVAAAATTAARVARIALADCVRWRTGTVDPRLSELLTPALLARVIAELDLPTGTVTSLLTHLPEDDGNGHRLAAAVARGCDGSAPLEHVVGPPTLAVATASGPPRLVVTGEFGMDVAFGPTRVHAGQDWVFTVERSADGWRLADAATRRHVNWV